MMFYKYDSDRALGTVNKHFEISLLLEAVTELYSLLIISIFKAYLLLHI